MKSSQLLLTCGAPSLWDSFCSQDNGERGDFSSRRLSLVPGFCLHFHYISTILSDAYILSSISWLGFNLLTHSAHSPCCPVTHGESERAYITAHESRQNEMHSRHFQMVLIYGRGPWLEKKCIKCNLITVFDAEFMSDQTLFS